MSRLDEIVAVLGERGFESVSALATRFEVDTSTIRRDLAKLEKRGTARRTHGGAVPHLFTGAGASSGGFNGGAGAAADLGRVGEGSTPTLAQEKAAIGAAMAQRILEGQTVLLSSGSTTLEVARQLDHKRLTVVTHDLQIGLAIAKKPTINLIFIGGELLPYSTAMWGPMSSSQVEKLRVDVAVFGADTVTEEGLFAATSYDIELKRQMRSIASEAFFVADSTKFGREALFRVFGFDDFTAGITDSRLDTIRAARFPVPLIRV